MTRKEKNKLNGDVKVYNMYEKYNEIESVPQIREIERMEYTDRVGLYKFLKSHYSNKILLKHWRISSGTLYTQIYKKYNLYIPRSKRNDNLKKVGLYNGIDQVPSINVILEMTSAQKKGALTAIKEQFRTNTIINHWGISKSKLYMIYREHGITRNQKHVNIINSDIVKATTPIENKETVDKEIIDKEIIKELSDKIASLQALIENRYENSIQNNEFKMEINGEYKEKDLENKLLSLANILEENKSYRIRLVIEEL